MNLNEKGAFLVVLMINLIFINPAILSANMTKQQQQLFLHLIDDIPRSFEESGTIDDNLMKALGKLLGVESILTKSAQKSTVKSEQTFIVTDKKILVEYATEIKKIETSERLKRLEPFPDDYKEVKHRITVIVAELNKYMKKKELTSTEVDSIADRIVGEIYTPLRRIESKRKLEPYLSPYKKNEKPTNIDLKPFIEVQEKFRNDLIDEYTPSAAHSLPLEVRLKLVERLANLYYLANQPGKAALVAKELIKIRDNTAIELAACQVITFNTDKCEKTEIPQTGAEAIILGKEIKPAVTHQNTTYCKRFSDNTTACVKENVGKLANRRIIIDPGHLGGKETHDSRNALGYREGYGNFVVANLLRYILVSCFQIQNENIVITRSDLFSVGGLYFSQSETDGKLNIDTKKKPNVAYLDSAPYREAYISSIVDKDDLFLSIHTDGCFEQRGTVFYSRPESDQNSSFLKSAEQVDKSRELAESVINGLNRAFYNTKRDNGKTCAQMIQFNRSGFSKDFGDYYMLRGAKKGIGVVVEGFSHYDKDFTEQMVKIIEGSPITKDLASTVIIDEKPYPYHILFDCYAEGLALGIASKIGCLVKAMLLHSNYFVVDIDYTKLPLYVRL